jgi:hypothetical protein
MKTYEIPAKFMLTTETDLKEIGLLVFQAEQDINSLPMVQIIDMSGNILHKGLVRVHFSMPKEIK